MNPIVLVLFFAVSMMLGLLVSPLAQLAWLVAAAVAYPGLHSAGLRLREAMVAQRRPRPQVRPRFH